MKEHKDTTTGLAISVSKLLIWVGIFQLWEQGKIDLDEDIRTYLPEGFLKKANKDEKITMVNLMLK